MRFLFLLAAVSFVFGSESQSATILRLSSPFTDHAVLQQGKPLPVWGTAPANASVKVEFAGVSATSIADARGQWRVNLPPQIAGGPHRLLVTSGDQKTAIEDVLIGEVWLASGQSNMAWRVIKSSEPQEAVASASTSNIRYLSVTLNAQVEPQRQDTAVWQIANPENAKDFSAVAWNFARHLRPKVNVPIGLIVTAWGGTEIQSWMSRESLQNFPD